MVTNADYKVLGSFIIVTHRAPKVTFPNSGGHPLSIEAPTNVLAQRTRVLGFKCVKCVFTHDGTHSHLVLPNRAT